MKDRKFYCNSCRNYTNHEILFHKKYEFEINNEVYSFFYEYYYYFVECKGCSESHFVSEYIDESLYEGEPLQQTFPPRKLDFRSLFLENEALNHIKLYKIYRETLSAYDANLMQLAGCGIRLCLETIMNTFLEKENIDIETIDHMSMSEKLDKIAEIGYIGSKDKEIMSEVIEFGHASIHRNYIPKKEILLQSLFVIESVIISKIIAAEKIKSIKAATPRRPPKPPKAKSAPKSPPA